MKVKRNLILKYKSFLLISSALAFFTGCNEPNDLGMELLPSTDLIEIKNIVEKNSISSYTYSEDSIRTDEANKSLLGNLTDPVFGNTTIDFATQFRLLSSPEFGTNPVADSVKLYLYYRNMYGDTTTLQRLKIYELNQDLIVDTTNTSGETSDYPYYQNVNLKSMASTIQIGEFEFVPEVEQDSASGDTLYQLLGIPLDISLGDKLVSADSMQTENNEIFLDFFKGLYIEVEKDASDGGAILALEAASNDDFQGSALLVYYNNDENKNEEEPDTLFHPYVITQFSARVNSFNHDYSETKFISNLNQESEEDSLIYIQPTGGLKSKIYIDNLSLWKDSANTAINKAELIFQVDTITSEVDKYPPPDQLIFSFIDENGNEYLPADYAFNPSFYGGALNTDDYTYRFNITQHVQQIIEGKIENYGFFLSTARKNSTSKRVVIKGSQSNTGIQLIVTYSKFLQ
jgi:hypothetical protein